MEGKAFLFCRTVRKQLRYQRGSKRKVFDWYLFIPIYFFISRRLNVKNLYSRSGTETSNTSTIAHKLNTKLLAELQATYALAAMDRYVGLAHPLLLHLIHSDITFMILLNQATKVICTQATRASDWMERTVMQNGSITHELLTFLSTLC